MYKQTEDRLCACTRRPTWCAIIVLSISNRNENEVRDPVTHEKKKKRTYSFILDNLDNLIANSEIIILFLGTIIVLVHLFFLIAE